MSHEAPLWVTHKPKVSADQHRRTGFSACVITSSDMIRVGHCEVHLNVVAFSLWATGHCFENRDVW